MRKMKVPQTFSGTFFLVGLTVADEVMMRVDILAFTGLTGAMQ